MDELIEKLRILQSKNSLSLYKREVCRDAADAIERLTDEVDRKDKALIAWLDKWESTKGKLIDRICENCDTPPDVRLRVCGECPIISPIREVFDE